MGHAEPRGPRHAVAIGELPGFRVTFIDAAPDGHEMPEVAELNRVPEIERVTLRYPHRGSRVLKLIAQRATRTALRLAHNVAGVVTNSAFSSTMNGLCTFLARLKPDVVYAHNIDTLLPAWKYAVSCAKQVWFDSMEFHSAMGEGQDPCESRLIKAIESKCLPDCRLITSSGPLVSDALAERYGVSKPLALYNVPRLVRELAPRREAGLSLYWRNSTIGLGQRGLQDAIVALSLLPNDVVLFVQGRPGLDGNRSVSELAERLKVNDRVKILPPCRPEEAVVSASAFDIGLCLEHGRIENHQLTVSNKFFDYHMAGLAVVASNLPPFRALLQESQGGILFEEGNANDLARVLRFLYSDPIKLNAMKAEARRFALTQGNLEFEIEKLKTAAKEVVGVF